jgi:uncharacterized protein YbjT (DUF2867 family)
MTILVTGATGRVGRHVVQQLVSRGASVRVLVRDPSKAEFPAGVEVVQGELLDIRAVREALSGVRTLFLLPILPIPSLGLAPPQLATA